MARAIAICSCPRLGFMDFMGFSLVAFAKHNVAVTHSYGAYWMQALSEAIKDSYEKFDYIFVTDYDSLFTEQEVGRLLQQMEDNPKIDAICSLQAGRLVDFLFSVEGGQISREEMSKELVPVRSGAFGLTIFRSSVFGKLKKPWFRHVPDSNGGWQNNSDKLDADMYFWKNFRECGKQLYLSTKNVIGHLELMVKWPDTNLKGMYQTITSYKEHGAPGDVWQ